MKTLYFEIQFFRLADKVWCQSSSAPTHDMDVNELEVWKAYTKYLALAYPDTLYRLVQITTEKKVEPIHV